MVTGGSCTSVPRIHWADTCHNMTHNARTEKSMPAGVFGRPWIERGIPHNKQQEDAYMNAAVASYTSAPMIHWADTCCNMAQNIRKDKKRQKKGYTGMSTGLTTITHHKAWASTHW